ncbi:hypothetical protein NEOLEDRAFT_1215155 [Neolentinus lepideus HHB14362 ss-1]|uniref:RRM domain-containing protein n=1 Tax=Neolentinus lepideus HHB14362 ss-1 TaxID=1314782 RepID=A0A165VB49_9AGAM|nr:hypothetical protein NEOLEDRAFT_1215155 [Neolentinus lepideus HHB14362 ss-1]
MSTSASSTSSSSGSETSTSSNQLKRKRTAVSERSLAQLSESESDSESDSERDEVLPDDELSDIPVLSRAEKRRQKKKQKLEVGETDSSPTKQGKSKGLKENKPSQKKSSDKTKSKTDSTAILPQRQNSVWVGNLSYRTTPQSIREFFKDVGEITRVHMPTKAAKWPGGLKENRGFAYVDFASPDAKVIAITLSEQELEGRRLLIKDGDDFTGRPTPATGPNIETSKDTTSAVSSGSHSRMAQKILSSQKQPPGPTLFLGNLSFESTVQSIREMLEAHRRVDSKSADKDKEKEKEGWIRKIRLGTFEDSGSCKGWAFVDFTSIEHATAVLVNPRNHHLDGRKLVVQYASPEAVRRGGGLGHLERKDKYSKEGREVKRQLKESLPKRKYAEGDGGEPHNADEGQEEGGQFSKRERRPFTANGSRVVRRDSGRDGGTRKVRAKPGAALAQAPRASATIVPSQGQKIKF